MTASFTFTGKRKYGNNNTQRE